MIRSLLPTVVFVHARLADRAQVTLDRSIVGYPALIGMTDFSHVWLLFVFHDNTNATVNGVVEERPPTTAATPADPSAESTAKRSGGEGREAPAETTETGDEEERGDRWGDGAREYRPPKHKHRQTFLTKVW